MAALRYCIVVVGEGIKDAAGTEVGADKTRLDAFGHPVLAGAAEELKELVQGKLNTKTRTVMLGYAQRAAAHCASLPDADERLRLRRGRRQGRRRRPERLHGQDRPRAQPDGSVKWTTGLQPLADIANVEHFIPRDWISEDGFLPNEKFVEYARPLIEGEVSSPSKAACPSTSPSKKRRSRRSCHRARKPGRWVGPGVWTSWRGGTANPPVAWSKPARQRLLHPSPVRAVREVLAFHFGLAHRLRMHYVA